MHVFPYSRREGTPAYDFPGQLPEHEKEDRSRRMTAAVEKVRAAKVAAMQGRTASVPVSYTHLDVYKRQRWMSGSPAALSAGCRRWRHGPAHWKR